MEGGLQTTEKDISKVEGSPLFKQGDREGVNMY